MKQLPEFLCFQETTSIKPFGLIFCMRPFTFDFIHGMQAQGTRDVPQKAGDAEAHVAGVAQAHQHQGRQAHHDAGNRHQNVDLFQKRFLLVLTAF